MYVYIYIHIYIYIYIYILIEPGRPEEGETSLPRQVIVPTSAGERLLRLGITAAASMALVLLLRAKENDPRWLDANKPNHHLPIPKRIIIITIINHHRHHHYHHNDHHQSSSPSSSSHKHITCLQGTRFLRCCFRPMCAFPVRLYAQLRVGLCALKRRQRNEGLQHKREEHWID